MSHVTTVQVVIRDLETLAEVCSKVGLQFKPNQKHYHWFGRFVGDYIEAGTNPAEMGRCDHAISVIGNPYAYEIGVVAKKGSLGMYELRYDFYAGGMGLEQVAGPRCSNLIEAYTETLAIKEVTKLAESEGYEIITEKDPQTGETVITLRSYD